ncbi:MAG: glycosyltransferase [Kiritimatiellaeota bacterium]|nr:glycosyltransferase [Kiritimatiellota bacterium]
MKAHLVSVVIPTRNEAGNIVACLDAFLPAVREGWAEIIVVDNRSTDATAEMGRQWAQDKNVAEATRVVEMGPERSAQRNKGWQEAKGEYAFFVDADMRLPEETLREIRETLLRPDAPDALYVRETRMGNGAWTKVRNFERGFYDATCIDGLRVIRQNILAQIGGYDETLWAAEDWDLDRRILQVTSRVALTQGTLLHDERRLTLGKLLKKKAYYAGAFARYQAKWHHDAVIRKQFGFAYRFFGVFFEHGKWRRALRHPLLMAAVWAEKICVGLVYLWKKL